MLVVPSQLSVKCVPYIKEIGRYKKETMLVDHERYQSIRIENSKQIPLR